MSQINNNNNFKFNIDMLMNDVNNVIQNGMNNLLKDFIDKYKLYEETHNCIMNLPCVKREIYKTNEADENFDDLPDLISMSSECDNNNYTRIPIHYDSDQESDDTLLCMKKVANQLLKEKSETIALFQEEEKSYKEIIENRNKEIDDLKDRINVLSEQNDKRYEMFYEQKELYENALEKCSKEIIDLKNLINIYVKQPVVCDLACGLTAVDIEPTQEVFVEIKQEKENIILHIEENSEQADDEEETESGDEDEESVEEGEEVEDEEDEEEESVKDAEDEDEEAEEEESVKDAEELEEDVVETEKSESDAESLEGKDEVVEEDEDEELIEIEIDDLTYCTNDEENGFIYELDNYGNVGEVIGYLKDGEPFFN